MGAVRGASEASAEEAAGPDLAMVVSTRVSQLLQLGHLPYQLDETNSQLEQTYWVRSLGVLGIWIFCTDAVDGTMMRQARYYVKIECLRRKGVSLIQLISV